MKSLICHPWEVLGLLDGSVTTLIRPVVPQSNWEKVEGLWLDNYFAPHGIAVFADDLLQLVPCPFPAVGERFFVQEPFIFDHYASEAFIDYAADLMHEDGFELDEYEDAKHMLEEFSRCKPMVASVNLERLHELIPKTESAYLEPHAWYGKYMRCWGDVAPELPWESNPWVWLGGVKV